MIRCTATTRHISNPNRCIDDMGHAAPRHRYVVEGKVNEFSESNALYPPTEFTKEELKAIIKGDI